MRVVWDERKADANARKHGVTLEEAATVFFDPLALIVEDLAHPENARIIGESEAKRILLVVFVEQDEEDTLRLISARRATRHERRRYEEGE
jgi:uncharacterized protein